MVYVRTGQYLEPDGKEGLAELTGYLLARGGTKSKTAEELEERLAFLAAHLDSGVGETQGSVSLNLLSKDLDEGLGILREVLTAPRFQDDKIALRKQQMLQAMKERNDDSRSIEGREAEFLAYGEKFWANRYSTAASVDSMTRADLEAFPSQMVSTAQFRRGRQRRFRSRPDDRETGNALRGLAVQRRDATVRSRPTRCLHNRRLPCR